MKRSALTEALFAESFGKENARVIAERGDPPPPSATNPQGLRTSRSTKRL
jgi:hypothetical protein